MKIAQGIRPAGVYIPHFVQISVTISVLGSYNLTVAPMGMKFVIEEYPAPLTNFTPNGATSKSASE